MLNNINNLIRQTVSNMLMPQKQNIWGMTLALTAGVAVSLDFKTLANQNTVDNIQGIWIDNSNGTAPLGLSVPASLQNFTVPTGYQGVAPLYVTPDLVINFLGTGNVPVTFLNFPTPVAVWPANTAASGAFTFTGGNLNTRDVNIAANTEAGGLDTLLKLFSSGDVPVHARAGNPISGQATAAGAVDVLAGAPSVFLSSADISVDGNASLAAAGPFTVTLAFGTSGLQICKRTIVLPNAAPATATPRYELFNQSDLNFLGAVAADKLTLTLSAALTSGAVQYTLGAGTTAVA